ncbi:MAG: hypothetical protein ACLUEK_11010 [Oscillospiraceae bacterium]
MGSGGFSVLLVLEELLKVVPPGLFLGETLGLIGLDRVLGGPLLLRRLLGTLLRRLLRPRPGRRGGVDGLARALGRRRS